MDCESADVLQRLGHRLRMRKRGMGWGGMARAQGRGREGGRTQLCVDGLIELTARRSVRVGRRPQQGIDVGLVLPNEALHLAFHVLRMHGVADSMWRRGTRTSVSMWE